jgi:hypothetical protein
VVGLSVYSFFEDRCWVISNMQVVDKVFVDELLAAYEYLFTKDPEERDTFRRESATQRRLFSRKKRLLPVIGRDGRFYKVLPKSNGTLVPAKLSDFTFESPFQTDKDFREAIALYGGSPEGVSLQEMEKEAGLRPKRRAISALPPAPAVTAPPAFAGQPRPKRK